MRRLRHLLPLAVSATLVACAPETPSPGKSNDALQEAPDGKIPPHTSRNPFDIPLSEAELQKREAIATELRQQMQTDIYNNAVATLAANSRLSSGKSDSGAPVNNFPPAVVPTPVATTVKPVTEAQYGDGESTTMVPVTNTPITKAAYAPSDDELPDIVKAAILDYWNALDKADVDKLKDELAKNREWPNQYCWYYPNVSSNQQLTDELRRYGLPLSGWYYVVEMNDPSEAIKINFRSKEECFQYIDKRYEPIKEKISNFKPRSKSTAINVERADNYEGNIISYVTFRAFGTDQFERYKVSIQSVDGKFVVTDIQKTYQ